MPNYSLLHSLAGALMNTSVDKLFVNWKSGLKFKIASIYGGSVLKFCEYTDKTPRELINDHEDSPNNSKLVF